MQGQAKVEDIEIFERVCWYQKRFFYQRKDFYGQDFVAAVAGWMVDPIAYSARDFALAVKGTMTVHLRPLVQRKAAQWRAPFLG